MNLDYKSCEKLDIPIYLLHMFSYIYSHPCYLEIDHIATCFYANFHVPTHLGLQQHHLHFKMLVVLIVMSHHMSRHVESYHIPICLSYTFPDLYTSSLNPPLENSNGYTVLVFSQHFEMSMMLSQWVYSKFFPIIRSVTTKPSYIIQIRLTKGYEKETSSLNRPLAFHFFFPKTFATQ